MAYYGDSAQMRNAQTRPELAKVMRYITDFDPDRLRLEAGHKLDPTLERVLQTTSVSSTSLYTDMYLTLFCLLQDWAALEPEAQPNKVYAEIMCKRLREASGYGGDGPKSIENGRS
jgi:hypothetical protein